MYMCCPLVAEFQSSGGLVQVMAKEFDFNCCEQPVRFRKLSETLLGVPSRIYSGVYRSRSVYCI